MMIFSQKFSFCPGSSETPSKKKEVKQRPPEQLSTATTFIAPHLQAQLQPVMAEQAQIPTFKLVLVGDGGTGKVTFPIRIATRLILLANCRHSCAGGLTFAKDHVCQATSYR